MQEEAGKYSYLKNERPVYRGGRREKSGNSQNLICYAT